jgi:hypothetical protein
MLGFRGAPRYYSDPYREGFALECRAIRQARDKMRLSSVVVMVPFCRTLEEVENLFWAGNWIYTPDSRPRLKIKKLRRRPG